MSDETDYEALEKSVKYIPWKGKKNGTHGKRLFWSEQ